MNPVRTRMTLSSGRALKVRPRGNSMLPLIKSGQEITLEPVTPTTVIERGSIVFCKVRGNYYVHLVSAVRGDQYQISNNHGRINGWTHRKNLFGILAGEVEA